LQTYKRVTAQLHAKGIILRDEVEGALIKTKKQRVCKAGDFLVAEIDAKLGGFGIVPSNLAGSIVSSHYFLFDIDITKLAREYLDFFIRTEDFQKQVTARGSTNYAAIRPPDVLQLEIPLPPLKEQQGIVITLNLVITKIEKARKERAETETEIMNIKRSLLRSFFSPVEYELKKLEDACEAIIDNLHSTPRYDGNEFPCVRSQDVNDGYINFISALKTGVDEFNERIRRAEPRVGDIVYVREGDVGRCAVVDGTQRFSLGQRVMMFRPDQNKVDPKFLFYQLTSPLFHEDQVLCSMMGTTSRHVNIKDLRNMRIIIPPLPEQRSIVAHLDRLQINVDKVKRLQAETEREMVALVPAVLAKAFGGSSNV
jgi:type I restriction enzyme, S subunit